MSPVSKKTKRSRDLPLEEEEEEEEELNEFSDDDDDVEEDSEEENGKVTRDAEMEELEKEYNNLRDEEPDILINLNRHKDEDLLKGQAVNNQKAIWDKSLELRFLLQKVFTSSNKLPREPLRSSFCGSDEEVNKAYSDLMTSSEKALDSLLGLQEALLEKNPSIVQVSDGNKKGFTGTDVPKNFVDEKDKEWFRIQEMHSSDQIHVILNKGMGLAVPVPVPVPVSVYFHFLRSLNWMNIQCSSKEKDEGSNSYCVFCRLAPFRDNSIDKWQRRAQVTTGVAGFKGKLQAFSQNSSEQVAAHMRDPSRLIKRMHLRRPLVGVFGSVTDVSDKVNEESVNADGDPELLDDSEFYQQLLKEFLESSNPESSQAAFYALKRQQTKKRKIVDRRASKSRKIRYHVHEKIVSFMAPDRMNLPEMAPILFQNLFGLKRPKSTSVA
ncbi:hypothetical protein IFM89_036715 [Coptis chinensis]|uniref:Protein AATF n=1 Tax=Coptis chinensis TaxID=261450 RepID=A0A835IGW0_9MAGN|nr:hypothetical protein IFM89_036715 [Coptis chinensis]